MSEENRFTGKVVIGYDRVSTKRQAEEGSSLEAQDAKIRAWAALKDIPVLEVFTDSGISGGRADNRPALQAALKAVREHKGVLVVYSLSRFARSTRDAALMLDDLEKNGADFVSISEDINTTSAAGKMIFRLLAVMAEFERDQTAERTRMTLQHLKSKGKRVGEIPYGFDCQDKTLVRNEREQEGIEIIKVCMKHHCTFKQTCAALDLLDVPTKKGGRWCPSSLGAIINGYRKGT